MSRRGRLGIVLLFMLPGACAPSLSTTSGDGGDANASQGGTDASVSDAVRADGTANQDSAMDALEASHPGDVVPGSDGVGCGAAAACGCAKLFADPQNFGSCGHVCMAADERHPHVRQSDVRVAVRRQLHGDCDGNSANGCETPLLTTPAHCGACGTACPAAGANSTEPCVNGVCTLQCTAPFQQCGDTICSVDTGTDTANCGSCGQVCPAATNATASCSGGQCMYTMQRRVGGVHRKRREWLYLPTWNTDLADCGSCGRACPSGDECTAGVCICIPTRCGLATFCGCGEEALLRQHLLLGSETPH